MPIIKDADGFDILKGSRPNDLLRETKAFVGEKEITSRIIVDDSGVNYHEVGEYPLYYYVSHDNGQVAIEQVNVRVIETDDIPPVFIGLKNITVEVHEPINLLENIQAMDNVSGNLTTVIQVDDSNLDMNQLGEYDVTYSVEDEAGNETVETITVSVVDQTPPDIQIKLDLRFKVGTTPQYEDFFIITDNYDSFHDLEITIDASQVDNFSVGSYEVKVTAKDKQNNVSTESFLIYVYSQSDSIWTNPYIMGALTSIMISFIVNLIVYGYIRRKTRRYY